MIAELLVFTLLAAAEPAVADGPREPRPLRVLAVEGLPPDSATQAEFMAGFEEALAAGELAIETRAANGAWGPAGTRENRFAPAAGAEEEKAWSLQVVVRAPPPFTASRRNPRTKRMERYVDREMRASRGMTVALAVLSPEAVAAGARAMPEHFAFAFPQAVAPAGVVGELPGGFRFPWRESGRVTARLALELLHRRAGDLGEDTRCDLAPALRAMVVR